MMQAGFKKLPVDEEFARRSARYLASRGYPPAQIRGILVDELEITAASADKIVSAVAA